MSYETWWRSISLVCAEELQTECVSREMEAASQLKPVSRGFRIRAVALPVEHGGWSLLLEPIVVGLLLAPTISGLFVSLAATGAFLARHPFKLAVRDWRRKLHSPRTVMSERFAILYAFIAIFGLAFAINTGGTAFLFPFLLATPSVILQLFYDATGRSRALVPELAGSISTAAVATAIAISGGWPSPAAYGLWVILAARATPTILYVRARIQQLHDKQASPSAVIFVHVLAVLVVIALAMAQLAPYAAVLAMFILLVRASVGFSKSDRQVTARKIGMREVVFGAMTIFLVTIGYA